MNGKGDKRRPKSISNEEFKRNWDAIFNKKEDKHLPLYDAHPTSDMFDHLIVKDKEKEETKKE